MINKLKHLIPQKTLLTIYNSLILPHINYCILAWGHDSNRILKLQKKAIRIIVKGSFYTHSDPIFKKFNILKVNDIHLRHLLKFYFKSINNILPDHFYDFNLALNSDIHDYNTRGKTNWGMHILNMSLLVIVSNATFIKYHTFINFRKGTHS